MTLLVYLTNYSCQAKPLHGGAATYLVVSCLYGVTCELGFGDSFVVKSTNLSSLRVVGESQSYRQSSFFSFLYHMLCLRGAETIYTQNQSRIYLVMK